MYDITQRPFNLTNNDKLILTIKTIKNPSLSYCVFRSRMITVFLFYPPSAVHS